MNTTNDQLEETQKKYDTAVREKDEEIRQLKEEVGKLLLDVNRTYQLHGVHSNLHLCVPRFHSTSSDNDTF